ncbi:MAG: transketolase [Candidatus Kapabacteria bacterium]|nr:transketolase [Candidatus Kapabacteria bacterium]
MIPYESLLLECVRGDERVMILTAENRGHMRNAPALMGDNFIDVGIAEQTMIGMAAGLAARGRIVLTHALASFITLRAFEFIRDDVGIPALPVIMVGMVPGILSDGNGPTHQAIDDVGLMRGIPNINVFCPSDEDDLIIGMREIIFSGKPYYVRYTNAPAAVDHDKSFTPGVAEIVAGPRGCKRDVTILCYGVLLRQALQAAARLSTEGITVQVVNLRTLKPIDESIILDAAVNSDLVVCLEDHFLTNGLHSIVCECLVREQKIVSVLPIGFSTWFRPAILSDVLDHEELSGEHIARRIKDRLISQVELQTVGGSLV